jgi:methionyl-tRNA formyltransferase
MSKEVRPLVFLGTPEPAAFVLKKLLEANFPIAHVVTRKDARRGRGGATSGSAVKVVAQSHGIEVSHDLEWITHNAHLGLLGIVVAYGRLIPAAILDTTPMINVHFSLLPRWRGAAPVERAILAGDEVTGVCIMDLEETLDTGPVHACREVPLTSSHTATSLTEQLAEVGSDVLIKLLTAGLSNASPQMGEATYAAKISPSELRINWNESAEVIHRKIRALRSFTSIDGLRLRILEADISTRNGEGVPGHCGDDGVVATGEGCLVLRRVQPEGKNPMDAGAWLRGRSAGGLQFDVGVD